MAVSSILTWSRREEIFCHFLDLFEHENRGEGASSTQKHTAPDHAYINWHCLHVFEQRLALFLMRTGSAKLGEIPKLQAAIEQLLLACEMTWNYCVVVA